MGRLPYTPGTPLPEYRTRASCSDIDPGNLLRQQEFARHFGFRSGLVSGSSVFAYLSHSLMEFLGADWLGRGFTEFRFLQPLYEMDEVRVAGVVTSVDRDGTVGIDLQVTNPLGTVCATARVELTRHAARPGPARESYPCADQAEPRPISIETLQPGENLSPVLAEFDSKMHWAYCQKGIRDHQMDYGGFPHPGWLLMQADRILLANYQLPAWMHMASEIQSHAVQQGDCVVETRGKVRDKYEREGDHYVVADLALFSGDRCIETIVHTVIFRIAPRAA